MTISLFRLKNNCNFQDRVIGKTHITEIFTKSWLWLPKLDLQTSKGIYTFTLCVIIMHSNDTIWMHICSYIVMYIVRNFCVQLHPLCTFILELFHTDSRSILIIGAHTPLQNHPWRHILQGMTLSLRQSNFLHNLFYLMQQNPLLRFIQVIVAELWLESSMYSHEFHLTSSLTVFLLLDSWHCING